jgi:hypothetical protein
LLGGARTLLAGASASLSGGLTSLAGAHTLLGGARISLGAECTLLGGALTLLNAALGRRPLFLDNLTQPLQFGAELLDFTAQPFNLGLRRGVIGHLGFPVAVI